MLLEPGRTELVLTSAARAPEDRQPGWVSTDRPGVLTVGLAAALGSLGWPTVVAPDAGRRPVTGALRVVVLSEPGPAAIAPSGDAPVRPGERGCREPPHPVRPAADVYVGSPADLPLLLRCGEAGAAVFNSQAPLPVLTALVDEALGSPATARHHESRTRHLRRCCAERAALDRLTAQEDRVLRALLCGWSAAEIARGSQRSLHTVRSHIRAVLTKLDVQSQTAACAVAERSGVPLSLHVARARFANSGDEPPW